MNTTDFITLTKAAKLLPGRTKKTRHVTCVWRWAIKGSRGVVLRTEWIGGMRYTTEPWLQEFLAAVAEKRDEPHIRRTTPNLNKRLQRARAELRKMGVAVE